MMRGGHSVLERARRRLRVLQLRLRDPRPHRHERVGRAVPPTTSSDEHPAAARHDVDDARAGAGAGESRSRTAIAGKTSSGRTSRSFPNGSFGSMGGMLTSLRDLGPLRRRVSRRVAAARRPGDGADHAIVAARDAADLVGRGRRPVTRDARPARFSSTPAATASGCASRRTATFATHRRAQRRTAWLRHRSCAGCPNTASASSRSATAPTPAGAGRRTTRSR